MENVASSLIHLTNPTGNLKIITVTTTVEPYFGIFWSNNIVKGFVTLRIGCRGKFFNHNVCPIVIKNWFYRCLQRITVWVFPEGLFAMSICCWVVLELTPGFVTVFMFTKLIPTWSASGFGLSLFQATQYPKHLLK